MITDVGKIFALLHRWNRRRVTINALMALSDWQLKDLGITRGQIPEIVDARLSGKPPARTAAPVTTLATTQAASQPMANDHDTPLAA